MAKKIEKNIGNRVAQYRRTAGLTQEQLAAKVDLSVESISRLERGSTMTSIAKLDEIAQALGIELVDLFNFQDGKSKKNLAMDELVRDLQRRTTQEIELVHSLTNTIFEYTEAKPKPKSKPKAKIKQKAKAKPKRK